MRLTSVELHPANSSEAVTLSFRDPTRQNPFNVKTIVGLDADEIIAKFYGGSGNSKKFYNLSQPKKDIVIRIALNPRIGTEETYYSLRDQIYRMISSSRTGTLEIQFKDETTVVAVLSGFVTKVETPQFNREQEVQITVKCSDGMLRAPERLSLDVSEFDTALTVIDDDMSHAPHGFIFSLELLDAVATLTIQDPTDDSWLFSVSPVGGFLSGDILYCSSELDNKALYLVRSSSLYYLADRILPGSIWPIIFPGVNNFSITPAVDVTWDAISHYPTYWGV